MDEETSPTHQANASDCFFVFNDDECVCVCDPHLYPVGCTPSFFLSMFTHFKSDKKGEGGPRHFVVSSLCLRTSAPTQGGERR